MTELTMLASGFTTVEGPTMAEDGSLYVSDVRGGGVHRLRPDGSVELVVPKRRGVGGLCLHADGGIVVSGRDVAHVRDGQSRVLFRREDIAPVDGLTVGGFNDLGADGRGRLFVGAQRLTADGEFALGVLVMITAAGVGEVVHDGLLPNGNCVSPDGRTLYQVHSTGPEVLVFDIAGEHPSLSGSFSTGAVPGRPDGACTDEDGNLWIAFHHGGCIAQFRPDGALVRRIDMPTPYVTSLCFGAPGTTDLYVVTDDEEGSGSPGGCIYRLDAGVRGAAVHPARA